MITGYLIADAAHDCTRVRRRQTWSRLTRKKHRRPEQETELPDYNDIGSRHAGQHDLGIRNLDIDTIVGGAGPRGRLRSLVPPTAAGGLVGRWADHRGLLLRNITAVELALVALATVIMAAAPAAPTAMAAAAAAMLLAVAMGLQNTIARRLAVPDLTTTVLTMTLTGIAADLRRSPVGTTARRGLAGVTMFAGALAGAQLALHTTLAWALVPAALALAAVVAVATATSREPAGWQNHKDSPGPPRCR